MENAGDRQQIDRSTWGWCKECQVLHDLVDTAEKLRESDAVDAVVSQLGLPPEFNEEQAEDYENQIGFIRKLCMKAVVGRLDKVSRDGTERYTVHSVSCG